MHGGHNINLVFECLLEISEDLERLDGRVGVQGVAPALISREVVPLAAKVFRSLVLAARRSCWKPLVNLSRRCSCRAKGSKGVSGNSSGNI